MITNTVELRPRSSREIDAEQTTLALSIVVPTRNEAGNIERLLMGIKEAFHETSIEVIFVDDSSDDTPLVVEAVSGKFPSLNVRLIHRASDERVGGLGGAVVLGLQNARSAYACVMDGDMQHPPEAVPNLLNAALDQHADLVVATRRSEASKVTGLNTARNLISKTLDLVARIFFSRQLRGVSDPLTGFFLVRVKALNLDALRPKGFKILLEILVRNPHLRKAEVPFHFGERLSGESKASATEAFKYLSLLWTLRFGEKSLRFIGFALIGASGILVNTAALYLVTEGLHIYYMISVILATVASTTWNFALIETLVYRAGSQKQGRLARFSIFFVLNTGALLVRSPLIYLMTSVMHIFYVLSNLVSLILLVIARFFFSDSLIWGQKSPKITGKSVTKTVRRTMKKTFSYNIHNIVTIVSEGFLPELEPFRVQAEIQEPTIRVQIGLPRRALPGEENGIYTRYREIFGHLGFEVGIEMGDTVNVTASPVLRMSPHVLYTNVVEPILRWTFVKKGYALVHGATIAFGNSAYMITARTDTGKTTTLLKILAYQRRTGDRAAFLSDDMTIVSPDGTAMTYPKPLTISAHTLHAVNADTLDFGEKLVLPFQSRIHSRSGRKFAMVISKTHLPAATINMVTQMIVPPPKYFVEKLVPNVKLTSKAVLNGMFIIERGQEQIVPMENSEAMEILLQNCEDAYGFPPYANLKEFLYCYYGVDLHEKEQEIIRQALGQLPASTIRSNTMNWWSQIPAYVNNEQAYADITRALQVEIAPRASLSRTVSVH
jgi:dolichol-phosphate mannosyltransferase